MCPRSTLEEMEQQDDVRVAWGSGIAGHVAESGNPVNIPDAYKVNFVYISHYKCIFTSLLGRTYNNLVFNHLRFNLWLR